MYRLSQTNCAAGPPTGVGRPRSVSPAALRFTWRAAGAKRASTAGSCTGCQSVSRAPPTRRTVSQLAARHVADERSVPESAVPAPACSDAVDAAVDNYRARVVPRRAEHHARGRAWRRAATRCRRRGRHQSERHGPWPALRAGPVERSKGSNSRTSIGLPGLGSPLRAVIRLPTITSLSVGRNTQARERRTAARVAGLVVDAAEILATSVARSERFGLTLEEM